VTVERLENSTDNGGRTRALPAQGSTAKATRQTQRQNKANRMMGIGTPSSQSRMERPRRNPPRSIGHGHRRQDLSVYDWRSCGSKRGVGARRPSVFRQSTPQSLELPRSEERDRTSSAPCCNQNQARSFFYCWSVDVPAAPPLKGWLLSPHPVPGRGCARVAGGRVNLCTQYRQQPPHQSSRRNAVAYPLPTLTQRGSAR